MQRARSKVPVDDFMHFSPPPPRLTWIGRENKQFKDTLVAREGSDLRYSLRLVLLQQASNRCRLIKLSRESRLWIPLIVCGFKESDAQ